ncbi:intercellular adhesion molecule 1-like [Larus michahellis]|uniref:intercellular adhesion molecule 1-like n=1 Tax=Larus michahellis TaxID=119627 RepID=UPI003D9B11AE
MGSGFCSHPRGFRLTGAAMSRRGHLAWFLAGLLLVLCGQSTDSFEVRVEGNSSEVGYGGTVLLNCSSSCPEAGAPRGLETSLSKERVSQGPGWVSVRLRNITEPLSDVLCYFYCFGERKVAAFRVLAYEFPQPQLTISSPNTSSNETVAIKCSSAPSWPPGLKLRLHRSHWHPQAWEEGPISLELVAREEDDGAEFSCQAQLSLGNRTLTKSSPTATLRVTYQPWMDDRSCPPSQNWTEGQDETLRCWAWGNPRPHLECAKDREPFPAGVPRPVTRAHAGTYLCRATNPLGTTVRTVTIWVQYHDPDLLLPVLVGVVVVAALVAGGVGYGIYYRKKKIREYRLQEQQRRLQMEPPRPTRCLEETAALNGSAPEAQV